MREWQAVLAKTGNNGTTFERVVGDKATVFDGMLKLIANGFQVFARPATVRTGAWTTSIGLADRLSGQRQ